MLTLAVASCCALVGAVCGYAAMVLVRLHEQRTLIRSVRRDLAAC